MVNYPLLKTAFETPPFSLASAGDIMAVLKPDLMDIGFEYFGSIALVGGYDSGKTAIMKACKYSDQGGNINIWSRSKEFDERLKQFDDNSFVLTDDAMKTRTETVKNRGALNVDTATHRAFQGDGPILAFTIEQEMLDIFGPSSVSRLLYLNTDIYWTEETRDLLTDLQDQKASNREFLAEFKCWYANRTYDFRSKLKKARKNRNGKTSRLTDMVFFYQTTLEIVSDFFKDKIGEGIAAETIQALVDEIVQTVQSRTLTREELTELMLRRFIKSQKNDMVQRPVARAMCRRYINGVCRQNIDNQCDDYDHCFEYEEGYYSPEDLILDESRGYHTVLIDNPGAIWCCPHDLQNKPRPILVVPAQYLVDCLNRELEDYCYEKRTQLKRFTTIESRKVLCSINRVVCIPEAKGNRYTLPYRYENKNHSIESIRVVFVILTEEEAEYLRLENKRMMVQNPICPNDEQRLFVRIWKDELYQIVSMAGPVGLKSVPDKNCPL